MANVGFGVTIGSSTLRAVKLRKKGESFILQRVFSERLDEASKAVAGRALANRFKGVPATVGLTGRDVIIRYTQVPPVPDWRLRNLMKFEVEEVSSQSGGDVSADFFKLNLPDPDGDRAEDAILVALARNTLLDQHTKALAAGGLKFGFGCPNSVALFNAFAVNATYGEDETALLVNIGADNVDIAIQQGGELLFARNATPGGSAFTDAIAQAFSTSATKAEKMKAAKGDVTPKGQARYPDPTSEKVANAIMGEAGKLSSMIQSTLMIAKAQLRIPDLRVDRVCLAGGGASLKGLDKYLKQAMGVPVERFNPFDLCDTSQLTEGELAMIEDHPHEFAVAVGLAQTELERAAVKLRVMPAALRKARDFATKGIFAIAAAAVMVGVLAIKFMDRSDAGATISDEVSKLGKKAKEVDRKDKRMRSALQRSQVVAVKQRLLAERPAPGAHLAQSMQLLEETLLDPKFKDVYLDEITLRVTEDPYNFQQWIPKNPKKAAGYTPITVTYGKTREAVVEVRGRITRGSTASRTFTDFFQAISGNQAGLDVEALETLKTGRGRLDPTFRLQITPGLLIRLNDENSLGRRRVILRRPMALDSVDEPTLVVARTVDGARLEVPLEDIESEDRKAIVERLKKQAPAQE